MQKKLFILSALLLSLLSGCTSADTGITLSEVSDEAVIPADEASFQSALAGSEEVSADIQMVSSFEGALEAGNAEPAVVVVFVCGAVADPGVYEFPEGTRIDEAIKAAGGFLADADKNYVNLAARLTDGVKLQIPTLEEVADGRVGQGDTYSEGSDADTNTGTGNALVNINTATKEQLTSIPGIGDGIAGKIIRYREDNGSFRTKEDIMKVSGIKDKFFAKIRDHITV